MKKRFRTGSYQWRCWVLDDGKRMLGHVCVQLFEKIPNPVNEPELHAYVTNFYVIPEMRNQGLGKRLLNKALSWCRARRIDAVILWPSPASQALYRRCGFVAPSDIFELPTSWEQSRPGENASSCDPDKGLTMRQVNVRQVRTVLSEKFMP